MGMDRGRSIHRLGAFYLIMFWGRFYWSVYVVLSGSLFLVGILFLVRWKFKPRRLPSHEAEIWPGK